jgi:hypothetical protein
MERSDRQRAMKEGQRKTRLSSIENILSTWEEHGFGNTKLCGNIKLPHHRLMFTLNNRVESISIHTDNRAREKWLEALRIKVLKLEAAVAA